MDRTDLILHCEIITMLDVYSAVFFLLWLWIFYWFCWYDYRDYVQTKLRIEN